MILDALFGTSNSLAVGPVAMVSLLVYCGIGALVTPGSLEFIGLYLTLALIVGVFHIAMAAFRFGLLVNFISHQGCRFHECRCDCLWRNGQHAIK